MSKKNVVIIGGGYAGVSTVGKLQGYLPTPYRIVLIEQQDFFYVKLAGARAAASEDIADQILVPYDKLFKSPEVGVIVKSSVTKINPHSVVLSEPDKLFGSEIAFDYLVIAVGCSWNGPIALETFTKKDAVEEFSKRRQQIAAAENIVIVGAGPVGIELSGEIKMAHPEKHVTIIHAGKLPISDAFPDSFREKAVNSIREHGVELLLNEKVDTTTLGTSNQLKLKSGKTLRADLILHAYGAKPRGDIIRTLSTNLYNPNTNSIRVKETLQVADGDYPNIFAVGDVADTQDLKMAYKAGLHGPIVAKNILSLIKSQTPTAVYKPTNDSELMVLPMGNTGGLTYIPYFGGFTLGDWVTKTLKGKTLLVPKARALVGY